MRIGIVGGGQLARMLALAGRSLGFSFVFVDPAADACAAALGDLIVADYDDEAALDQLAASCDVVTLDFENVPVAAINYLNRQVAVHPGATALAAAQDRVTEKSFFNQLDIATPAFVAVESEQQLIDAQAQLGDCIAKTRRFGYDGKGQAVLMGEDDAREAWKQLANQGLIVEQKIAFARELSVLIARSTTGQTAIYPLSENTHSGGILQRTVAPAKASAQTIDAAHDIARRTANALGYVGLLAIELFELPDGRLLVNEMAPRVHNSGHWTIDGAVCSQFENHLRAITGLPLGDPSPLASAVMLNWIGQMPSAAPLLEHSGLHWHDYGKKPRTGRKVGHATIVAASADEALATADTVWAQASAQLTETD